MNNSELYPTLNPPTSKRAYELMAQLQLLEYDKIEIFSFGSIYGGKIIRLDVEEETLLVEFDRSGGWGDKNIVSVNLSIEDEHLIERSSNSLKVKRSHKKLVLKHSSSDYEKESVIFSK